MSLLPQTAEPSRRYVTVMTHDAWLLARLTRLCGVAEVELVPAGAGLAVQPELILAGLDSADQVSAAHAAGAEVVIVTDASQTSRAWEHAARVGAAQVVTLPEGEPWLMNRLLRPRAGPQVAQMVCVLGGRGGAGASVFAAQLAMAAARSDHQVLALDLDPLGCGLDFPFALDAEPGLRWEHFAHARGTLDGQALLTRLPVRHGVAVLSFGPAGNTPGLLPDSVGSVLRAATAAQAIVVADCPRQLGPVQRLALASSRLAVLIVPAEIGAAVSARRVAQQLAEFDLPIEVVVRGPAPGRLPAEAVVTALGLNLAGEFRATPAVSLAIERGELGPPRPGSPLGRLCDRLVTRLGQPR